MSDRTARVSETLKGVIAWMAQHTVAANLLMLVLTVGGLVGAFSTKQEVFPEFALDMVNVTVPYPGASPAEVEQGIVLAIEEAVRGIDGVKRVASTSSEGRGVVQVELLLGADADQVLSDVKNEVDRIETFPEEAEEPTIAVAKRRRQVISLVVYGDQELQLLHEIAERARADLLADGEVTQVEIEGVPPLEVSIEVPRENLEKYGFSLQQIASEVSQASLELPGGGLDTARGEILVRVAERRRRGNEFEDIVLRSTVDNSKIRLGEIADVRDGYEDNNQASFFNGQRAVRVTAYRVGDQTPTAVAKTVREYAKALRERLPPEISLMVWNDDSEILQDRIDLLTRNAFWGFGLVILILALFLDLRLALWVALGIPVSFLGSFLILVPAGVSINMVTLFAFIVTLGMVVDDAIVVGERTYTLLEEGMPRLQASVHAARDMAVPVTFAILTSVAAFAPLFFVPGTMGKIFMLIPAVVVSVLLISLVESFFVLPAHLGHGQARRVPRTGLIGWILGVHSKVDAGLDWAIVRGYRPMIAALIRGRRLTLAAATALLVLTVALVVSGRIPFNFFPQIEGDVVTVEAQMPFGTAIETTERIRDQLERSAGDTIRQLGGDRYVKGMFTRLGEAAPQRGPGATEAEVGSHLVTVEINLVPGDRRPFTAAAFAATWERITPEMPGLEAISFSSAQGPGAGAAVAVQVIHPRTEVLADVSREVAQILRSYPSLRNVENEYSSGKPQLDFHLRPEARALGLRTADLAAQLRGALFGAEAIREQRGRNELKVYARLPEKERSSEHDLERYLIRTPTGGDVPLGYVAWFERGRAPTAIHREDGQRKVTVSAELAEGVQSPREVLEDLQSGLFVDLRARYPELRLDLVGAQREQAEAFSSLRINFLLGLGVIFVLLAIPFRSYVQPVIVMAVIPFGFVGAVAGHVLMGYSLSIISIFGIIALSGVVVNDSLVLIDATNKLRARGLPMREAIVEGAASRMRPILLTSLTTFFGLVPMIAETSIQARFLIPMAISLGFGVLFSTLIVLLVVPTLYVMIADVRMSTREVFNRPADPFEAARERDPNR